MLESLLQLSSYSRAIPFQNERELLVEHAAAGMDKIVARSLRLLPPAEAPLFAWPIVCGSAVAERSRAISFSAGTLRIEVADAGWKRELQTLAPRYLAGINRYLGQRVEHLEFIVRAPRSQNGANPAG